MSMPLAIERRKTMPAKKASKRLKKAKKLEATKPLKPTAGDIVVTKPTNISSA
jgi:hypothetical protein